MIRVEKVRSGHRDLARIEALMEASFPANERIPTEVLLQCGDGAREFLAFYDDDRFVGYINLLTYLDITHILYFAVDDALRGCGYGSRALAEVHRMCAGRRMIADLECPQPGCGNADQRAQRMRFYLRCGYGRTQISYDWRGESYVILSRGGDVTEEEFDEFWRHFARQQAPDA